jgi:hypothetical protein
MDNRHMPVIQQRIQDLAHSILKSSAAVSTETSTSASLPDIKTLLRSMQSSASEIQLLTKDLLEPKVTLFPMLPVEIRLIIWRMALPGPRIVEVYLDQVTDKNSGPVDDVIKTNTPPPTLMHVNFESRKVALEKYWLRLCNPTIKTCLAQIDPAEDTIFIPWSRRTKYGSESFTRRLINGTASSEEAKQSVRFMAVDERAWGELSAPKRLHLL